MTQLDFDWKQINIQLHFSFENGVKTKYIYVGIEYGVILGHLWQYYIANGTISS